jgi:neutral ceramidase
MLSRMVITLLVGFISCLASASIANDWSAGVARVDITPSQPMFMGGYASRTQPADGKLTNLWAKALVLQDGSDNRAVLITADLVAVGRELSLSVRRAISKKYSIPLRSIAINVSHTHSGPAILDVLAPQHRIDEQKMVLVRQYSEQLQKTLIAIVEDAIDNMAACRLSFGEGQCGFAVNRRENKEADVPRLIKDGRLKGPVDHSVPVLKVSDLGGRTLAVVFGYACHATVTNFQQWSGDYPGFAQMALEKAHPDAVAMFVAGCGADQNPLPRRHIELARSYGTQLAEAVQDVLNHPMRPIAGKLSAAYREVPLAFGKGPSLDEIRGMLKSKKQKTVNWARIMLARLKREQSFPAVYPYPVQTWRIGNGPLVVFLGGEVVVDYSLRMKSEFGDLSTWTAGYSNDVMNYIPSRRVFLEGGYEGVGGMYSYALHAPWTPQIEQDIFAAVHELARSVAVQSTPLQYVDSDKSTGKSAAVVVQDSPLAHTALLVPLDKSGKLVGPGDAQAQTQFLIEQLRQVLATAESSLDRLVRLNVYAATPADVKSVEQTIASAFDSKAKPAMTLVAGDMPYKGVLVTIDGVAASSDNTSSGVSIRTNNEVFHEPKQSHVAILPPGEKAFLSGWISRTEGNLETVVDGTLEFQIKLLEQLGGRQNGVVQIRAFVNMSRQRETVQRSVTKLFKDQEAVPPIVFAPWSREGAPEIEFIAAGRPPRDVPQNPPRVEYFNVPGMGASPVFSRASRVNSDRLIYVSGIVARSDSDAESQVREILGRLQRTLRISGSDLRHMAKATYYLADREATTALGKVRRELYDPKRPPAASAFLSQSVGYENRSANVDMIAVPVGQ